ncbi:hypothetical protein M6B38_312145 [Iris pallida]|uniref:Uncharacterized protein n=1 Tax=Iris pallida TaxID=29817 RepID=A0AAX6HGI7_IRIPA|nr:hypothetical protein M6B38_312145 [Iris pallida]
MATPATRSPMTGLHSASTFTTAGDVHHPRRRSPLPRRRVQFSGRRFSVSDDGKARSVHKTIYIRSELLHQQRRMGTQPSGNCSTGSS